MSEGEEDISVGRVEADTAEVTELQVTGQQDAMIALARSVQRRIRLNTVPEDPTGAKSSDNS